MNENININNTPVNRTPVPPKPKREYTAAEMVFAWLCLLFGYLFCRVFPVVSHPLGGLLFSVSIFLVTAVILKIKGSKFNAVSLIFALSALAMQAALILSANSTIHFWVYAYALFVYLYFVYSALGNSIEAGFSDFIAADFLKAAFAMPFASFDSVFPAISSSLGSRGGKPILRVILGIALAFIPTLLIVLLLSYDDGFTALMEGIFSFDLESIFSHIISFCFGIPIAMYIFGHFVSSADRKLPNAMSKDKWMTFIDKLKFTHVVTVCIAVLPIIAIYIIFFISQWQYYVSGFSGILPADLSYAEYARSGFFELCTVSFINFFIIAAIGVFMKQNGKAAKLALKLVSLVFSFITLVLIATALAKMSMYIDRYGLTPRRVYATWGMIVLALIFLLIILKQFIPRFRLIAAVLSVVVILFGALALSGIDGYIAEYNVDRYLDGSLSKVDIRAIAELGDAGVPELVRLAEEMDDENGTDVTAVKPRDLTDNSMYSQLVAALHSYDYSDCDVFSYTIPQSEAKAALEDLGIKPWTYDDYLKLPYYLRPW